MSYKLWIIASVFCCFLSPKISCQEIFIQPKTTRSDTTPWTKKPFRNNPNDFQFAIVSDRTGGHRKGVFSQAVEKLNLLNPEFVMSVGDLIEGYTKDPSLINEQWAEFDSLLAPLEMRFFYVPGNHDISNERMRKDWLKRYGHAYYHFVYKDVLFLAMDTNDGDDDATFSQAQLDYIKKAITDNPNVRWTLLFMHHPVWLYKSLNGFDQIEALLKNRPYTVYAGHYHRYMQAVRQDRNYYVLSTTGGGSELRGPKFGEFDHVSWITMTDQGPKMLNLKLDGLIDHDIAPVTKINLSQALIEATDFHTLMTLDKNQESGKLLFGISNSGTDTIYFKGRIFHNHHLKLDQSELALQIAPASTQQLQINWALSGEMPWERIDPIELDFTIGYQTEPLVPSYELNGQYVIPKVLKADQIKFTPVDVFTQNHSVELSSTLQAMDIRYTLDGSEPTINSPRYKQAIPLSKTTTIKAALFDPNDGTTTAPLEKTYAKVKPLKAVKVRAQKPGLTYQYFEGEFQQLPDFSKLSPVRSGLAENLDVEAISGEERLDHYGIVYQGYIEVPEDGLYTLFLRSDDGSKLFLHDQLVVDNDGSHSARTRQGFVALEKGTHPIRIEYFEDFLGQTLELSLQAPGSTDRTAVSFKQLSHSKK